MDPMDWLQIRNLTHIKNHNLKHIKIIKKIFKNLHPRDFGYINTTTTTIIITIAITIYTTIFLKNNS